MKIRFWRKPGQHVADHDEAVAALKALEHDKLRLDRYDANPNDGYARPFNSVADPGVNL